MVNKMRIQKNVLYTILVSFVFSVLGTLSSRDSLVISVVKVPYFYTLLTLVCIFFCFPDFRYFPYNKSFSVMMVAFLVSSFFNSDPAVWSSVLLIVLIPCFMKMSDEILFSIMFGTALGQLVFLFRYGLTDSWNGNSVCTAIALIVIICIICKQYKPPFWMLVLISFISEMILIIMASRTSIIAFSLGVAYVLIVEGKKANGKWSSRLTILLVGVCLAAYKYRDMLFQLFLNKWENRGYSGASLLTGRGDIWLSELKYDWTVFGHGEGYFNSVYHHNDAHNIFIQVLGRYGSIALFLFIIFMIMVCVRMIRNRNEYSIVIIPVVLSYLCAGMFENTLFIDCKMYIPAIEFLLAISILLRPKEGNRGIVQ